MAGIFQRAFNLACLLTACAANLLLAFIAVVFFLTVPKWGFWIQRCFGKTWLFLMGISVTLIYEEEKPPSHGVIAPNHSSWFDIPVIAALPIDVKWLSKKEVRKLPLVGLAMQAGGFYFVARDHRGNDVNVMREVEEGLRRRECVVIFPEGTRTRTGELLPFKKGAFRAALGAQVPFYPVAITGTRLIAPPGGGIPKRRGHRVIVRIGKPLWITADRPLEEQIAGAREVMVELLAKNEPLIRPAL